MRSAPCENKAIVILRLQHSVNKLKARVLESGLQLKLLEVSHMQLTHDLRATKRSTTTWMLTIATSVVKLLSLLVRMVANSRAKPQKGEFFGLFYGHPHGQGYSCHYVLHWFVFNFFGSIVHFGIRKLGRTYMCVLKTLLLSGVQCTTTTLSSSHLPSVR